MGRVRTIDKLVQHARQREAEQPGAGRCVLWIPPERYEGIKFEKTSCHALVALAEYGQTQAFRHCLTAHPEEMRAAFQGPPLGAIKNSSGRDQVRP